MGDTYDKLITLLDRNGAAYRLIDHPPDGLTDLVSAQRGHQIGRCGQVHRADC
jgi:Ala-tRNA(Pro) deacylase